MGKSINADRFSTRSMSDTMRGYAFEERGGGNSKPGPRFKTRHEEVKGPHVQRHVRDMFSDNFSLEMDEPFPNDQTDLQVVDESYAGNKVLQALLQKKSTKQEPMSPMHPEVLRFWHQLDQAEKMLGIKF